MKTAIKPDDEPRSWVDRASPASQCCLRTVVPLTGPLPRRRTRHGCPSRPRSPPRPTPTSVDAPRRSGEPQRCQQAVRGDGTTGRLRPAGGSDSGWWDGARGDWPEDVYGAPPADVERWRTASMGNADCVPEGTTSAPMCHRRLPGLRLATRCSCARLLPPRQCDFPLSSSACARTEAF